MYRYSMDARTRIYIIYGFIIAGIKIILDLDAKVV
nr:MAG TPA: hypothetical protein [Bacteriophage sp.]